MRQNNLAVIINDRGKKEENAFLLSIRSRRREETDFQGCGRMEVGGGGLFFERPSILGGLGGGQKGKERV